MEVCEVGCVTLLHVCGLFVCVCVQCRAMQCSVPKWLCAGCRLLMCSTSRPAARSCCLIAADLACLLCGAEWGEDYLARAYTGLIGTSLVMSLTVVILVTVYILQIDLCVDAVSE
jgi:hypothetical protein